MILFLMDWYHQSKYWVLHLYLESGLLSFFKVGVLFLLFTTFYSTDLLHAENAQILRVNIIQRIFQNGLAM